VQRSRFNDLDVYVQAASLADELRELVRDWEAFDKWSSGLQLLRAADSIGANIAEAYGRHGYADQRRLLYIARGSAYETEHWINRAEARNLLESGTFGTRVNRLVQTLNGLIRAHHRRTA
jgi:four helix bundle protein